MALCLQELNSQGFCAKLCSCCACRGSVWACRVVCDALLMIILFAFGACMRVGCCVAVCIVCFVVWLVFDCSVAVRVRGNGCRAVAVFVGACWLDFFVGLGSFVLCGAQVAVHWCHLCAEINLIACCCLLACLFACSLFRLSGCEDNLAITETWRLRVCLWLGKGMRNGKH